MSNKRIDLSHKKNSIGRKLVVSRKTANISYISREENHPISKPTPRGQRLHKPSAMRLIAVGRRATIEALKLEQKNNLSIRREKAEQLRNEGYDVKEFSVSLKDIVDAINQQETVEGIDILERMQEPKFRFLTANNVEASLSISHSYAAVIKATKSKNVQKAAKVSLEKRQENADEFAISMRQVVGRLKNDNHISTYREVVAALNNSHIPTYRGGKWHIKTLQDLERRWKELGVTFQADPK